MRLGLHQTAVSFALRGDPSISEETRRRVLAMARELGYDSERHHAARIMQQQRYHTPLQHRVIALLRGTHPLTHNPYDLDVFIGIDQTVQREGFDLILCNVMPPEQEDALTSLSLKRGYVDGVIFSLASDAIAHRLALLQEQPALMGCPVVTYFQNIPTCSSVTVDEGRGSYLATRHLLALGHRQIIVLQPLMTQQPWENRWHGITRALAEYGVSVADTLHIMELGRGWIDPEHDLHTLPPLTVRIASATIPTLLPEYLRAHPAVTAILAWNDPSAIHAWRQLAAAGFRVPDDISIIGFDDTHPFPTAYDNALTTVRQPYETIGAEAVSLLLRHIRDEAPAPQHVVLPCDFITRHSTAPPRNS